MKPIICGSKIFEKFKLKKLKSKSKSKSKLKSIPSNSVIIKKLPNNPYVSSITGKYAFNLSKIKNFKIYFWKSTDNPSKNEAIEYFLDEYSTPAYDWSPFYKKQTLNAFSQFTSFLNISSCITDSYKDSDVVCVLGDFDDFIGACNGPESMYLYPKDSDYKIICFISNLYITNENIIEGGILYWTLIHEFGHGFGLGHPFDTSFSSRIMPGIGVIGCDEGECFGYDKDYESIAAYINDSTCNSVMSYVNTKFFYPEENDFSTYKFGYNQTLMPLDASALRWMYNLKNSGNAYVLNYGVKVINPAEDEQKSQMIIGKNQEITFGGNCRDINFYFSNNCFRFNNLEPVKYQYNRIIEKPGTFYPQDLCSTVAKLNFNNTQISNIFIEKNALKTNLTVNCLGNTVLNVYIIDFKNNYSIKGNTYIDKKNDKKMTIINKSGAKINVYFNK